ISSGRFPFRASFKRERAIFERVKKLATCALACAPASVLPEAIYFIFSWRILRRVFSITA
ncbi:MAG: hypothetical protein PHO03_00510, partial [Candidatus Omnitrophica bacterium]|nr:hypothetical protein [Candidatus Omnitrophota bacterium]